MRAARYFSDHMIVQRDEPFLIWGFEAVGSVRGELVFEGRTVVTVQAEADPSGRFILSFPKREGGFNRFSLRLSDSVQNVEIADVRFGDVYLTMGQSNMSYPLSATEGLEEYRARAAGNDSVCFLHIPEAFPTPDGLCTRPAVPQEDLCGSYVWQKISYPAAVEVSAVSFGFAIELSERVDVPVGFVHTAMGGVSIDTYLSRPAVNADETVREYLKRYGKLIAEEQYNTFGTGNFTQWAGLYHEKICPLKNVRFKGCIWYQGENSALDFESGLYYERALRLLIESYREFFSQPQLPFVAIQIAPELYPYGDTFGYLYVNEAICRVCAELPFAWSIPIYDVEPRWLRCDGETYYHPIHPTNKKALFLRCAEVFECNLYRDCQYAFPQIEEVRAEGSGLTVRLALFGEALEPREDIIGFSVAGEDEIYYAAEARVTGPDTVFVECDYVSSPRYITYAFFQYNTACNLTAGEGHPVQPFRSKREPVGKNYYLSPLYACFGVESAIENNFGCEAGGGQRVPMWKSGTLIGSPAALEYMSGTAGEKLIKLTYCAENSGYFYFGAEPKVDLCGQPHHLDRFDFLSVALKAEAKEPVEFHGALFRKPGGMFKFRPMCGGRPASMVGVENEFTDLTIDLRECQRGDEAIERISADEKRQIYALELYFRCRSDATIYMKNLRLHNCPPQEQVSLEALPSAAAVRSDMQLPI